MKDHFQNFGKPPAFTKIHPSFFNPTLTTHLTHYPPFDFTASECAYWHHKEYDFDEKDRRAVYPHTSYAKDIYPEYSYGNVFTDYGMACPRFIAEQEHKSRSPLFAV